MYDTPWRYHVVLVSLPVALVILGSLAVLRASDSRLLRTLARGLFGLTILAIPVLAIGAFEGLYNHLVKNLLYFGGGSAALMSLLFPPPTYEMPNDVFFEVTGILQVVPAALAAWHLYHVRPRRRTSRGAKVLPVRSSRCLRRPYRVIPRGLYTDSVVATSNATKAKLASAHELHSQPAEIAIGQWPLCRYACEVRRWLHVHPARGSSQRAEWPLNGVFSSHSGPRTAESDAPYCFPT